MLQDNNHLALGCEDGTLIILNAENFELEKRIQILI